MKELKNILFIILVFLSFSKMNGQLIPSKPVSSRIYTRFVFNPAIAGSKDFSSLNSIIGYKDESYSTIITGDGRLSKKGPSYYNSNIQKEFRNIGLGTYLFNDKNGSSNNVGGAASLAYHFPVSKDRLSFFSVGASLKGVLNRLNNNLTEDTIISSGSEDRFFPNIDLGAYFYNKNLHLGFSVNNLMGNPLEADSLGNFEIPVSTRNIISAGYKVLLIRSINMVVEASFIYEFEKFNKEDIWLDLDPAIKIYMEAFCFGMFFNNKDMNSFFFQYRYPGFYLGAYYGMMKNSTFYLNKPLLELSVGINLSRKKFKLIQESHW